MNDYDGLFVTIEGIDCSGKSTVSNTIETASSAVVTSEPSDFWTGEVVYKSLASGNRSNGLSQLFYFLADREYHIENDILPALEQGMVMVCDRYSDSTRVYQPMMLRDHAAFDGESMECIEEYVESVMEPIGLEPDLTLWIDTDVDTCWKRLQERERDSYETREYLEEARDRYRQLEKKHDRIKQIDGNRSPEEIAKACSKIIEVYS